MGIALAAFGIIYAVLVAAYFCSRIADALRDVAAAIRERGREDGWQSIETAPTDGTTVWVYTAALDDLPGFQGACAYHPDAGWCTDELRFVTYWMPLPPPPEAR